MANAKQCDCCQTLYVPYEVDQATLYQETKAWGRKTFKVDVSVSTENPFQGELQRCSADLCKSCLYRGLVELAQRNKPKDVTT